LNQFAKKVVLHYLEEKRNSMYLQLLQELYDQIFARKVTMF
jgi:hypothetical protein